MRKEPRLHFTDEERADPALEKPIRKADRAAAKADKAQAKIPKKQVRQKTVDPMTPRWFWRTMGGTWASSWNLTDRKAVQNEALPL